MFNYNKIIRKLEKLDKKRIKETGIRTQDIINRINTTKFKQIQEVYSEDISLCKKKLVVEGKWKSDIEYGPQFETYLQTERAGKILIQTDELEMLGGGGTSIHPLSLCLAGFCGCFAAAFAKWCSFEGVELNLLKVYAKADLNLSANLGIDENVSMIDNFQLDFLIQSEANDEKFNEILELTKKRCFCSYCISVSVVPEIILVKKKKSKTIQMDLNPKVITSDNTIINRINIDELKKTQSIFSKDRSLCKKSLEVEGIWRLGADIGPQFEITLATEKGGVFTIQTDETIILGGGGTSIHPVALCISGYSSCFCTAFAKWCAIEGIELKDLSIISTMDIDLTTGFGIKPDIPMIDKFKIELTVESDDNLEKLQKVLEITKRRCLCYYCYSTPIVPKFDVIRYLSMIENGKEV